MLKSINGELVIINITPVLFCGNCSSSYLQAFSLSLAILSDSERNAKPSAADFRAVDSAPAAEAAPADPGNNDGRKPRARNAAAAAGKRDGRRAAFSERVDFVQQPFQGKNALLASSVLPSFSPLGFWY